MSLRAAIRSMLERPLQTRLLQRCGVHALALASAADSNYNDESHKFLREEYSELACPFFMPVAKLENGSWPHPARLPLGCGWTGHCTAPGHEQAVPSQDVVESFCNLG